MSISSALARRMVVLALGVVLAGSTVVISAPTAYAGTWCKTMSKTWYLSDGAVSLRLMTIRTYLEVCTDNRSITDASETTTYSFTGPAETLGWVGSYGPAVRSGFDASKSANVRANGYLKDCPNHWVAVLCGYAENFFVNSSVTLRPIVVVSPTGPDEAVVGRRIFSWSFTPHNGSGSHVHFNTTI